MSITSTFDRYEQQTQIFDYSFGYIAQLSWKAGERSLDE
jgi:hypothetical protein